MCLNFCVLKTCVPQLCWMPGMLGAKSCPRCCSSLTTCTKPAGRMLTSWGWSTRFFIILIIHFIHCSNNHHWNLSRWLRPSTTRCPRRWPTTSSKVPLIIISLTIRRITATTILIKLSFLSPSLQSPARSLDSTWLLWTSREAESTESHLTTGRDTTIAKVWKGNEKRLTKLGRGHGKSALVTEAKQILVL